MSPCGRSTAGRARGCLHAVCRATAAALLLGVAQPLLAQSPQTPNEIIVHAEPVAGGLRYLRGSSGFRFGASFTAGLHEGAVLADGEARDIDEWSTAHVVLALPPAGGLAFLVQAGAALAIGNDFSAVYPGAQAGIEISRGRLRIGSAVRTMRIAGGDGSGNYRLVWVPLRVGWAFRI